MNKTTILVLGLAAVAVVLIVKANKRQAPATAAPRVNPQSVDDILSGRVIVGYV